MKILLLAASFVLVSSTAHAQSTRQSPQQAGVEDHASQAGPSKSPARDEARLDIDHSMDRLVVEPTHSTVTLTVPSPAAFPAQLTAQSRQ